MREYFTFRSAGCASVNVSSVAEFEGSRGIPHCVWIRSEAVVSIRCRVHHELIVVGMPCQVEVLNQISWEVVLQVAKPEMAQILGVPSALPNPKLLNRELPAPCW